MCVSAGKGQMLCQGREEFDVGLAVDAGQMIETDQMVDWICAVSISRRARERERERERTGTPLVQQ